LASASTASTSAVARRRVQASIAASSSSTRLTRPALSASAGSSPRSSRPIAVISRLKMLSPLPAISTTPSSPQR
jgi:hypothetical protein